VTPLTGPSVGITVQADAAADDEEQAELRGYLRSMLEEHDFEVAEPVTPAEPAPGAKVGDPVSVNSLVVTLAASGGLLTTMVGALQAWLLRSSARQVVIEIDGDRLEVNGVTSEERRRLAAAWLERHESNPRRGGTDAR